MGLYIVICFILAISLVLFCYVIRKLIEIQDELTEAEKFRTSIYFAAGRLGKQFQICNDAGDTEQARFIEETFKATIGFVSPKYFAVLDDIFRGKIDKYT
jgi:hypothetical protein